MYTSSDIITPNTNLEKQFSISYYFHFLNMTLYRISQKWKICIFQNHSRGLVVIKSLKSKNCTNNLKISRKAARLNFVNSYWNNNNFSFWTEIWLRFIDTYWSRSQSCSYGGAKSSRIRHVIIVRCSQIRSEMNRSKRKGT